MHTTVLWEYGVSTNDGRTLPGDIPISFRQRSLECRQDSSLASQSSSMRTLVVLHNILYRHTSRVSVPASTTTTRTVSTLEYFSSIPYYYYAYSCIYIYILFTMHITTTLVLLQYESQYTSQQLSYYAQLVIVLAMHTQKLDLLLLYAQYCSREYAYQSSITTQYEYESAIIYPHTNYTECILSILYIYI